MDITMKCPVCGEDDATEVVKTVAFPYRDGERIVYLSVEGPIITCGQFGIAVTDWRMEDIRDDAVKVYRANANGASNG